MEPISNGAAQLLQSTSPRPRRTAAPLALSLTNSITTSKLLFRFLNKKLEHICRNDVQVAGRKKMYLVGAPGDLVGGRRGAGGGGDGLWITRLRRRFVDYFASMRSDMDLLVTTR